MALCVRYVGLANGKTGQDKWTSELIVVCTGVNDRGPRTNRRPLVANTRIVYIRTYDCIHTYAYLVNLYDVWNHSRAKTK